jgi:SAM-dependent methyltransferase
VNKNIKQIGLSPLRRFRQALATINKPMTKNIVEGSLSFTCNICGHSNAVLVKVLDRESPTCLGCGSNMRFRSLMHALTVGLWGKEVKLLNLGTRKDIVGIGMTDARMYADLLTQKFDYINTYYHQKPLIDITKSNSRWVGKCDFVISSDVFEHVPPPISVAFSNLKALLKPQGVVVFSVPFGVASDTLEHFPDLYDFRLTQEAGSWVLYNTTMAGKKERFGDLIFHGGPGSTLEMRLFSLSGLIREFKDAGFSSMEVMSTACWEHGIYWREPWSITILARA